MKKHAAFTLVELLVVLLICGLLISLLSHLIANSITWSRSGFEEEVIADQLEQALDFMEHDVRSAVDIDVDYFERVDSRPLSEIRTSYELRLLMMDEGNERALGRVGYVLRSSPSDLSRESPKERPLPNHVLYRWQEDSLHSGADQPLAIYLSSNAGLLNEERGFRIYYRGRDGARCSLADDIYSVEIHLAGYTKGNTLVTAYRVIPLVVKFE